MPKHPRLLQPLPRDPSEQEVPIHHVYLESHHIPPNSNLVVKDETLIKIKIIFLSRQDRMLEELSTWTVGKQSGQQTVSRERLPVILLTLDLAIPDWLQILSP